METYYIKVIFVIIISYLLGSIPTAYLIAKYRKVDIFSVGSGNMGATNVGRSLGIAWGVGVMTFDIIKGIAAIYISWLIMPESRAAATTISAITVIIGHNWSLFVTLLTGTLRGGKGAATAFGTLLMIAPVQVIVGAALIGGLIVARTRYVSLAVLTTFFLALVWMTILIVQQQMDPWVSVYSVTLAMLLVVRFKDNIQRLLAGTERRLGDRV